MVVCVCWERWISSFCSHAYDDAFDDAYDDDDVELAAVHQYRERLKIDGPNRVETSDFPPIAIWMAPSPVTVVHHHLRHLYRYVLYHSPPQIQMMISLWMAHA